MAAPGVVAATFLLFFSEFLFWTLVRGIYPFADSFASRMAVSRGALFFALSMGELAGALALFASESRP
jgi:hypothetical protein